MVTFVKQHDVRGFVAAGGVLAHYVGDASQPLHGSWLHHGRPPTKTIDERQYPVLRHSAAGEAFKKTPEAKIHAIYEQDMLEVDTAAALAGVDHALGDWKAKGQGIHSGHDAGMAIIKLINKTQTRLAPAAIIDADDPSLGPKKRAQLLWNEPAIRSATIAALADSVKLLANLWTSAWREGGGEDIAEAQLKIFSEASLQHLYRSDDFLPAFSLQAMAEELGTRFEP